MPSCKRPRWFTPTSSRREMRCSRQTHTSRPPRTGEPRVFFPSMSNRFQSISESQNGLRLAIGGSDVGAVLISMSASDAHGVSRSLSHYRCRERAPAGTMSTHTHTRRSRSRLCQKARSGPAGRSAYVPGCRTAPSLPGAMGRLAPCKRRRREGRGGDSSQICRTPLSRCLQMRARALSRVDKGGYKWDKVSTWNPWLSA